MPRLAIVISAVGSTESLEGTLLSVLENRPADCEIVVALKRPYADPYELKDEVRFVAPRRRDATTRAINEALATTQAPFVHVLASGCLVSEGWADAGLSRFEDRRVGAVVPWVFDAVESKRLFAVGIGYRMRGQRYLIGSGVDADRFELPASVIGPALFAAFYRKAALDIVGGFSRALGPRQADVDVALAFKQAGLTIAVEPRSQLFATAVVDPTEGAFRDALADERLFWRNLAGGSTAREVLAHLGLVSWDVLRRLPQPQALARCLGRSWAAVDLGNSARHRRLLSELAARAIPPTRSHEHMRIDDSHGAPGRRETSPGRIPAR